MSAEAARQVVLARVFQEIRGVQAEPTNLVGGLNPKIARPVFQQFGPVDRGVKFARDALGLLVDDAPGEFVCEAVNGIAPSVTGRQGIVASGPVQGRTWQPAGKGKQQRNAAGTGPPISFFDTWFGPQQVERTARGRDFEAKAVETLAREQAGDRTALCVANGNDR